MSYARRFERATTPRQTVKNASAPSDRNATPEEIRESTHALRASIRRGAVGKSVRCCGRKAYTNEPSIRVTKAGTPRARWHGVATCGSSYACPVCGSRKAAQRADKLDRMMRADAAVFRCRWQMVTFTVRHHSRDSLRELVALLFRAFRRMRSHRRMRRIFDRRVSASVRALEVTFSERNGWHPHIHVLWRTDEWDTDEVAALEEIWRDCVGPLRYHERYSIEWSDPVDWQKFRARYLSKLASEMAGIAKGGDGSYVAKDGQVHWHPMGLAQCERLRNRWDEYLEGMRGRQLLDFDPRANALAALCPALPDESDETVVPMYPWEVREVARLDDERPGQSARFLQDVEDAVSAGEEPHAAVEAALEGWLGCEVRARPWHPPKHVRVAPDERIGVLEISFRHRHPEGQQCAREARSSLATRQSDG